MIAAVLLALAGAGAPAIPVLVAQEAPDEEIWQVDQLRIPADTPMATLKALDPDHSMDAVIAHLKKLGIPYRRDQIGLLPQRLPADLRTRLLKLPPGEPFVMPDRDAVTINVILSRKLPADAVRFVPRKGAVTTETVA